MCTATVGKMAAWTFLILCPPINKNKPFYSRVYKIWEFISISRGCVVLAEMHCQNFLLACQYSVSPNVCVPQGQPNPVSSKTLFGN